MRFPVVATRGIVVVLGWIMTTNARASSRGAAAIVVPVVAVLGVALAVTIPSQVSSADDLPPVQDQQQAARVLAAYALNGPFSECMAERGYYVPWEMSIHLAPSIDDPGMKARERDLEDMMKSDGGVVGTAAYGVAGNECRTAHPAADDEELGDLVNGPTEKGRATRIGYWDDVLGRARALGWSPGKPFGALTHSDALQVTTLDPPADSAGAPRS